MLVELMAESLVGWMVALRVATMAARKGENLVESLVVTMVEQLVVLMAEKLAALKVVRKDEKMVVDLVVG